jgi:hypothetical protein
MMEASIIEPITLTVQDVIVTPTIKFVVKPVEVQLELDIDVKENPDGCES